jgi:hypothetical protein
LIRAINCSQKEISSGAIKRLLGTSLGLSESKSLGTLLGTVLGSSLGVEDGKNDGALDGTEDGTVDGAAEGAPDGKVVGTSDGDVDGTLDGIAEGTSEGTNDGILDGLLLGTSLLLSSSEVAPCKKFTIVKMPRRSCANAAFSLSERSRLTESLFATGFFPFLLCLAPFTTGDAVGEADGVGEGALVPIPLII